MSDAAALKAAAEAAEAAVTQQGDAVRALKASLKQGEATKVRKGRKGRDALDDDGCSAAAPINRWVWFSFAPRRFLSEAKASRVFCWNIEG